MSKKIEYCCWNCDEYFTIGHEGGSTPTFCPFCGERLDSQEVNEYTED